MVNFPLRVGIIGFGYIGNIYFDACSLIKDLKVVAISDVQTEKLKQINDNTIIKCNPNSIYEQKIDVLIITTPNKYHYYYASKAINCGIDVICEKPLATNVEDVAELYIKARKANTFLMMALHCRFRPEVQFAIDNLKGRVKNFTHYYEEYWLNAPSWYFSKEESGGGVLLDVGINQLDWLSLIIDDVRVTKSVLRKYNYDVELEAELELDHANGTGSISVSWNAIEEKKMSFIQSMELDHYILDHKNNLVYKNDSLIELSSNSEYQNVLKNYLIMKSTEITYENKHIIQLFNLLREIYFKNGEQSLSKPLI